MQHFLLSSRSRTLRLADVVALSDGDVETTFRRLRWPETDGAPVCPHCGSLDAYEVRRPNGSLRFRCPTKGCRKDFTVTSGTLFASHKKPLRIYLLAILLYANEVKGKNACAMSRDLGVSYKAAFVLLHKLREAMAEEMKGRIIGDDKPEASVDGAYFGGHIRPANEAKDRIDRRLAKHQTGKRKVVVVIREHGGETLPGVFKSEHEAIQWIKHRVKKGTVLNADEASSWNDLHSRYEVKRIDHQTAYSLDGACTNWAESFFSRIRRGEIGHYHHIAGPYLLRYAQEATWREDNRRVDNGRQVHRIAGLALRCKPSVDFCGYWQRHVSA